MPPISSPGDFSPIQPPNLEARRHQKILETFARSGSIQTSRGPPEVRPNCMVGHVVALLARSPHKVTAKNGILEGRWVAQCAPCGERDDAEELSWDTWLSAGLRVLIGVSPVVTPRRVPRTDRLKPVPPLMYVGLGGMASAREQRF